MNKKDRRRVCYKYFIIVLALFFIRVDFLYADEEVGNPQTIHWFTDYQNALEVARKYQKPLLLYFTGSDWSGWCMKLKKEIFDTPEFMQEVSDQFVFVEVDFPLYRSLTAEQVEQNTILKEHNGITNFPMVILLDVKQRILTKTGYLPGGGKKYAEYITWVIDQDQQLTGIMNNFSLDRLGSNELENLYKKAREFKRYPDAERLLEAGLKKEDNLHFLAEKYRLLVEQSLHNSVEALSLRSQLLERDPSNDNGIQFLIALTDFQILSQQLTSGDNPSRVVEPLEKYVANFGKLDFDNVWRVTMMMAQFYYDYDEQDKALQKAQAALDSAPVEVKPEIERSITYMRNHPMVER